jgi:hypothetical protein
MATCVAMHVSSFNPYIDGTGTVSSSPAGIDCQVKGGGGTGSCDAYFRSAISPTVTVTLTVTPTTGSLFTFEALTPVGSLAGCSIPAAASCSGTVALSGFSVRADESFDFRLQRFTVAVTKSGQGSGVVTSSPAGISCGAICSASPVVYGTQETLTAVPDAGSLFTGWTGTCAGQGPTCTLTIAADASSNAVFGVAGATTTTSPSSTASTTTATTTVTTSGSGSRKSLAARIVYAAVLGHGARRTLYVKIRVSELAAARIRLLRGRRQVLLLKSYAVKPTANELTATVPADLTSGTYQLTITLTDTAGHTKVYDATVLMPGGPS